MHDLPRRRGRRALLVWLLPLVPIAVVAALLPGLLRSSAETDGSVEEPTAARRPNILIIVTDDQRASGTMRAMPETARWFGAGGTRYAEAFATTPLCCPSRASILTGRYAHNHRVLTNEPGPRGTEALDHGTTIQRYLDEAGYRTGLVGKLLNNWPLRRRPPHFDTWAVFNSGYDESVFGVDGEIRRFREYSTDLIARRSTRFIRGSEDRDGAPWFLYVAPFAPHLPAFPADRYEDASLQSSRADGIVRERDRSDKPGYIQRGNIRPMNAREVREAQLRTLLSVDDLVARLAATLRRLDEDRRTLAVFVSDNGFAWGDRGWTGKGTPYGESIRVPLYVRWPGGGVRQGAVSRRITGTVDIAPTVLDAAGLLGRVEHPLDGATLLERPRRAWILTEYWGVYHVPTWAAIRSRAYHYIEHFGPRGLTAGFREYYDLRSDPGARLNLLADGDPTNDPPRAELAALTARLASARRCEGTSGAAACP